MGYSVKERADRVGTFRWITVQAMETLARWIPTTPELEVKILFGRHVWDFAQHADALGRRAFELRAPLHYDRAPDADYTALVRDIGALDGTADRLAAFYSIWCTGLNARYRRYIDATDVLMDEPTVRILERALFDADRLVRDRTRLTAALSLPAPAIRLDEWLAREARCAGFEPAPAAAAAVPA